MFNGNFFILEFNIWSHVNFIILPPFISQTENFHFFLFLSSRLSHFLNMISENSIEEVQ